jgi:hypothetical protein
MMEVAGSGVGEVRGPYAAVGYAISRKLALTTNDVPRNCFGGGGSTNSVEAKGQRERGLGAVAPQSGVPLFANE